MLYEITGLEDLPGGRRILTLKSTLMGGSTFTAIFGTNDPFWGQRKVGEWIGCVYQQDLSVKAIETSDLQESIRGLGTQGETD